jgi:hypothetical protein
VVFLLSHGLGELRLSYKTENETLIMLGYLQGNEKLRKERVLAFRKYLDTLANDPLIIDAAPDDDSTPPLPPIRLDAASFNRWVQGWPKEEAALGSARSDIELRSRIGEVFTPRSIACHDAPDPLPPPELPQWEWSQEYYHEVMRKINLLKVEPTWETQERLKRYNDVVAEGRKAVYELEKEYASNKGEIAHRWFLDESRRLAQAADGIRLDPPGLESPYVFWHEQRILSAKVRAEEMLLAQGKRKIWLKIYEELSELYEAHLPETTGPGLIVNDKIVLQRDKPGAKPEPLYNQAFEIVAKSNFTQEAYSDGFNWYCQQANLTKPDKKARGAFKSAMRRRRNALATQ